MTQVFWDAMAVLTSKYLHQLGGENRKFRMVKSFPAIDGTRKYITIFAISH